MGLKRLFNISLILMIMPVTLVIGIICVYYTSTNSNPFDVDHFRRTKSCPGCNLKGMDFTGMTLQNAQLEGADLRGVIFDRADLTYANLHGADIGPNEQKTRSTSFVRTNLSYSNLSKLAFVPGETLQGANLLGTNLSGASLISINFNNANLTDTNLEDADLTYADLSHAVVKNIRVSKDTKIGSFYRKKANVAIKTKG